ncbi:MAG: hypothetical protein Q9219_005888 [cf. Caloplaca sp. 3 TL-2023]
MHYKPLSVAAALLTVAVATPHKKPSDHHYGHHGKPLVFANNTAPIGTGTGLPGPTNVSSMTSVYTSYAYASNQNSGLSTSSGSLDLPQFSIQTISPTSGNGEICATGIVTVTVPASITETVTVTGSGSGETPSAPSPSSADILPSSSALPVGSLLSSAAVEVSSELVLPTFAASTATPAAPTTSQASEPVIPSTSAAPIQTTSENSVPAPPASSPPVVKESSSTASAPAPPASTSAAPVINAPAPQPGLPFKTKRGVIASGNSQNQLTAAIGTGKISWLGDWYSAPPPTLPSSVQFVPQCYNEDSDADGTFTKNANAQVAKGAKYLLSYGEPAAGKLSVDKVVSMFKKSMQPFAERGISVSAPTTLQNDGDFEWLESFLQACDGCTIGFLAIHYFNQYSANAANDIKTTLNRANDLAIKYKIPGGVWLDNFEVTGSVEQQKGFLQQIVPWLDAQDWVKAYAYVPDEVGKAGSGPNFIDGSGALNELGRFYADL